jgi:hypothetical protein
LALPTVNKEQTDDKIWAEYFRKNQTSGELKKIVSFVMFIPESNTYPERGFSHMNSVWSKARNRMAVNMVKAELQVRLNITEFCAEFAFFLYGLNWEGTGESSKERKQILLEKNSDIFAASTNF